MSEPTDPVIQASTAAPATRFGFPVSLDVAGRRCVVAGGGPMAREKAEALAAAGADVIEVAAGAFSTELLDGAFLLVVSGEDDLDTAEAFAAAEQRGVLANFLDDIPHCHFAFPALVQRGPFQVAISTHGRAPALARRLRLELEAQLSPGLGELVDAYDAARSALLPRTVPFDIWQTAWRAAVDDLEQLLAWCEQGDADRARQWIHDHVEGQLAVPATGGQA